MESLQDTETYKGHRSSMGGGITYGVTNGKLGNSTSSASAGKGSMNSDYASVTNQAGIYAGDGGFNINVENDIHLKGAVIDSNANADKNNLTTGTLTTEDIKNKASYDVKNMGVSYQHFTDAQKEADKDGTFDKALAHGIVAEISSRIAGNKAGSGFTAGMTNELLINKIKEWAGNNPAKMQWLSAALGATVNTVTGNIANTGAMVAHLATQWNNLSPEQQEQINHTIETQILTGKMSSEEVIQFLDSLVVASNAESAQRDAMEKSQKGQQKETIVNGTTKTSDVSLLGERIIVKPELLEAIAKQEGIKFTYQYDYNGDASQLTTNNIRDLVFRLKNKSYYSDDVWGAKWNGEVKGDFLDWNGGGTYTGIHWGNKSNFLGYTSNLYLEGADGSVDVSSEGGNGLNVGINLDAAKVDYHIKNENTSLIWGIGFSDVRTGAELNGNSVNFNYRVYLASTHLAVQKQVGNLQIIINGEGGIGIAEGMKARYFDIDGRKGIDLGLYLTGTGVAGGGEVIIQYQNQEKDKNNKE